MRFPKTFGGVLSMAVMAVIVTAVGVAILTRIPGAWPIIMGPRAQ